MSNKQKFLHAGLINPPTSVTKKDPPQSGTVMQTKSTNEIQAIDKSHLNDKKQSVPVNNLVVSNNGLLLSNQGSSGMIQNLIASKDSLEQLNSRDSGDVEYSSQDNDFVDDQCSEDHDLEI